MQSNVSQPEESEALVRATVEVFRLSRPALGIVEPFPVEFESCFLTLCEKHSCGPSYPPVLRRYHSSWLREAESAVLCQPSSSCSQYLAALDVCAVVAFLVAHLSIVKVLKLSLQSTLNRFYLG